MADAGLSLDIDPHVHSEDSYDGRDPAELILEHAEDTELDGVVITDHDAIEESKRAASMAPDYGLVGIPGVEVSTAAGHLLGLGVEERPTPGQSLIDTVDEIRDLGGIAIVPHPFQRSRHGIRKRRIVGCDGIEVYNSMLFTGYRNRRANSFAERWQMPKLGGSDAHSIRYVGRAYTRIHLDHLDPDTDPADVTGSTVIEAIRAGETDLGGRRTPVPRSARQYGRGVLRKSAYLLTSRLPFVEPRPASMQRF
ncbi:MAG: PHP-associated domain-containing protein [Halodesulfurarchaeum sp.]